AVPRLGRHVHGALPQHHARGQCHAAALGDQRQRHAVPAAAAVADSEAAGCDVRGPNGRPAHRTLSMRNGMRWQGFAAVAVVCAVAYAAVTLVSNLGAAQPQRWAARDFPNVELTTQDGARVRFYDDLLKGKSVAIDLIYTDCKDECPLETARLVQVQKLLGDRIGK